MTLRPIAWTGCMLTAVVLGLGTGTPASFAEPPAPAKPAPAPLPEGVVARVYAPDGTLAGQMTRETLSAALERTREPELQQGNSSPFTIFRELIEDMLVRQEAKRLGLSVSGEEVTARLVDLDKKLRTKSGGLQTLADFRKSKGVPEVVLRASLYVELLKEKIAGHPQHLGKLPADERVRLNQISVVIIELHKKATIVYGVSNPFTPQPAKLEPGVLALVNGEPLTRKSYGEKLFDSLPEDDLRDLLQKECATKVLETEGVTLSEADMETELTYRAELWKAQRMLQSQEVWRTIGYDEFLQASLKKSRAEVKADRYFRSYYGLMRRERAKVSDDDVAKEFESKKDSEYGPAILVHEFLVYFDRKNAVWGGQEGARDRREATQIVNTVRRQVSGTGRPFADVVKEVVRQYYDPRTKMPDPSVREAFRRLFNVPADKILYDKAALLKDGEVSEAIETLSEVHVVRRERTEPAYRLEQVREAVREFLAGLNAQELLATVARDSSRVQIRLPVRGN